MSDIDVKLLTVFAETYKTGSVSQTAVNLGLATDHLVQSF